MDLNSEVSSRVKLFFLFAGLLLTASMAILTWATSNRIASAYEYDDEGVVIPPSRKIQRTPKPSEQAAQALKGDCRDYQNRVYGFELVLSDSWVGCKTKEVKNDDSLLTVYFNAPTTSKEAPWLKEEKDHYTGYASIFAITVYNKEQWQIADNRINPNPATKITENDQFVFAYNYSQSYPADLQKKKLAEEVKNIIQSFKLL